MSKLPKILFASAMATLLAGTVAQAAELQIVSWGGAVNDAYRAAMWEPFAKQSGVKVIEDVYSGEFGKMKSQVEAGNLQWDVADPEWPEVEQGCREGLFEKIDVSQFDTKDLVKGAVNECGVMTVLGGTVLAYNTEKFPEGPKSWADSGTSKSSRVNAACAVPLPRRCPLPSWRTVCHVRKSIRS